MNVSFIRWPDEAARLKEARAAGAPRLLLVAPDAAAPMVADPLEDWVRLPAAEADIAARRATLEARASADARPHIDEDGLLHFRSRWVALSPVEQQLARALVERFGQVVGRDELTTRAWPTETPTRNALDVHVLRLRRRLEPVRLEIRTVRSRGYLLQPGPGRKGFGVDVDW